MRPKFTPIFLNGKIPEEKRGGVSMAHAQPYRFRADLWKKCGAKVSTCNVIFFAKKTTLQVEKKQKYTLRI